MPGAFKLDHLQPILITPKGILPTPKKELDRGFSVPAAFKIDYLYPAFNIFVTYRTQDIDRCCPFRWRLSPAHAANIRQIRHGPPLQKHPCIAAPTPQKFHPGLEKDSYIFKRPITENEASDSHNLSTRFEPYSSLNHVSYPKQSREECSSWR